MSSLYRRRRIIWATVLLTGAFLFYVSQHTSASFWSLPASLKDLGFSSDASSSRPGQLALAKSKAVSVSEIQALLHFVTEHSDRRLNEADGAIEVKGLGRVAIDPAQEIDVRVFAPNGDMDWEKHVRVLRDEAPLVVFSKTFCPFSQKAKALLSSYDISPPPRIVELNTREDGPIIQGLLQRVTGRRTVPNILLMGKSIGGSDDIHQLHDENKLKALLEESGLVVNGLD